MIRAWGGGGEIRNNKPIVSTCARVVISYNSIHDSTDIKDIKANDGVALEPVEHMRSMGLGRRLVVGGLGT